MLNIENIVNYKNKLNEKLLVKLQKIKNILTSFIFSIIKCSELLVTKFRDRARISSAKVVLYLWNDYIKTINKYLAIGKTLSNISITIIGSFLCLIWYFSFPDFKEIEAKSDLFYAISGLIGTVLALTFSLSALPIQKASESFGGTITHIYKNDIVFKLIFIALSSFCLSSIFLGSSLDKVDKDIHFLLIVFEIIIVSFSLDLIRAYNKRSNSFLSPKEGIFKLSRLAQKQFHIHNKRIKTYSKIYRNLLPRTNISNLNDSDVEKFVYQNNQNSHSLKFYSLELFEMANRSIASKQTHVAILAINEIANITSSYIHTYKDGFIIKPAGLMVSTSDANESISPILEGLQDLVHLCIKEKDELSCKRVLQAMGIICSDILVLESQINDKYHHSIYWLPLGYLESSVKNSIEHKLFDVGLEGVNIFNKLVDASPNKIDQNSFFESAIHAQGKFCQEFIKAGNDVLAEFAINGLMRILNRASDVKLFNRNMLWQSVFNELKIIVPASIIFSNKPFSFEHAPMNSAHSVMKDFSIPHLLNNELKLCEIDQERDHVSPYSMFLECSNELRQYLRSISDQYDLGKNRFLQQLLQLLENISDIFLHALDHPIREEGIDENELVNELKWQLWFLSYVFYKKKTVHGYYANMAMEIAAKSGLTAYKLQIWELDIECRKIIKWIALNLIEANASTDKSVYLIDDALECLCLFRIAAGRRNDNATVNSVSSEINDVIDSFSQYHDRESIFNRLEWIEEKITSSLVEPSRGYNHEKLIGIVKTIEILNEGR